jgi:hypothetical protein
MELYNSDGQRIQRDIAPEGPESFERRIPESGEYFLRVFAAPLGDDPPPDTPLDYRLGIVLPQVILPDGNDTFETAEDLGDTPRDVIGTGVDWWRVHSPSGLVSMTMTPAEHLDDPRDPRDDLRNLHMLFYNSSGYHRRSRVETKMHCVKLLGQRLAARDFERQVAEFQIRVAVLNGFTALGIPVTEAVG